MRSRRRHAPSARWTSGGRHDRFHTPVGSRRAIALATRRSPRSGAPVAVPDDRDCRRGAHRPPAIPRLPLSDSSRSRELR